MIIDNRYELGAMLGEGAMGMVFEAYDRLYDQRVALKQISVDMDSLDYDTNFRNADKGRLSFAREFRLLASLRHPNIISVLDYGFGTTPYYTMERVQMPRSFNQATKAEGATVEHKTALLLQLTQAIAYLHRRGIMHRDLKPSNALVTTDDTVKLVDFGLALDTQAGPERAGTIAYMAPEVLRGHGASLASDLWAIGVMAFEAFANHHPFDTREGTRMMIYNIMESPPNFDQLAPNTPPRVAEIIRFLLQKTPSDRQIDPVELVGEFCNVLGIVLPPDDRQQRESYLQAARFSGREAEWDILSQPLAEMTAGVGSAWVIGGESGVGKSRFLEELRIQAMVDGARVLWGNADETAISDFSLWGQVLRPLLLGANLSQDQAAVLRYIIPDIHILIGQDVPDNPPPDTDTLRQTILAVLATINQPTLLVVEDIHWSPQSLDVLNALVGQDLPLMIITSFRSDEVPELPIHLPNYNALHMDRLTPSGIVLLSQAMLGEQAASPEMAELLYRETEGNAFFMVEIIRVLAEEAGGLESITPDRVPEGMLTGGINALLERRLSRLPSWALHGLQLAAIMGGDLDLATIEKVIEPLLRLARGGSMGNTTIITSLLRRTDEGVTLDDWLLVCADANVLEVSEHRWQFAHAKLREYLLYIIDDNKYKLLNRHIAKAIEAVYPETRHHAARLARYWSAAGDEDKAAEYARFVTSF